MVNRYALIIGIENYPKGSGQKKVKYAANDAKAMAEYVQEVGFHLIGDKPLLDTTANYSEIMEVFDQMFHFVKQDSFVFLYYAGHGYYSEYGGYLIPYDYKKNKEINESCCISFDSINKRIRRKKPARFIFFLDTCHSGYAGKQIDIRDASSRDLVVTAKASEKISKEIKEMVQESSNLENIGRVVFTSSGPDEKSTVIDKKQHGLFTHYLLSGLKRKSHRKDVDIEELISFVKDNVIDYSLKHGLKQTPMAYTNIQGKLFMPSYKVQKQEGHIITAPDLKDSINLVHQKISEEDYTGAEKRLKEILEKDGLNFEANRLLEQLDVKRETARTELENEMRRNYEEWLQRGEGYMQTGNYKKAKECFKNAEKIYPENEMVKSFLKDLELKQQVIKIDEIEVPSGDKLDILKGLFNSAEKLASEKKYTEALNTYNKILKTYPENRRAIQEKTSLYDTWLQDYKSEKRYFEMLGILEDVILKDISIEPDFKEIYNEALLSYAESFVKTKTSQKLNAKQRELEKKEELIDRYSRLLGDYKDLTMDKEYSELNKVMKRLKIEADSVKTEIAPLLKLVNSKNFWVEHINEASETITKSIENGSKDKYLQKVFGILKMYQKAKLLPESSIEEINLKIKQHQEIMPIVEGDFKGKINEKIISLEKKYNYLYQKRKSALEHEQRQRERKRNIRIFSIIGILIVIVSVIFYLIIGTINDNRAFQHAKSENTILAYKAYLSEFKSGSHRGKAEKAVEEIIDEIKNVNVKKFWIIFNSKIQKIYKNKMGYFEAEFPYGIKMIYIPEGEFTMGTDNGDNDEKPIHKVYLDSYWIGKYEVTQGQWQAVMGNNPSYSKKGDNYPVEQVSWQDCQKFIKKIDEKTGLAFCLPTEAQWEKVARGSDGRKFPWGNKDPDKRMAKYGGGSTTAVGNYHQGVSPYGCMDMAGNVWEWCSDWYDTDYYSQSPYKNPKGPSSGSYRVRRGGGLDHIAGSLRCAERGGFTPADGINFLGFRLCLE